MTLKWPLALVTPHIPFLIPLLHPPPPLVSLCRLGCPQVHGVLLPQIPKCCLYQQTCPSTPDLAIFLLFFFCVYILPNSLCCFRTGTCHSVLNSGGCPLQIHTKIVY